MIGSIASAGDFEVLDEEQTGGRFEQRLRVPSDLPCLEGHFPGFPVVPGLALLRWAVRGTSRLRCQPITVTRIEALKFRELLRPGAEFVARVDSGDDRARVKFSILRGERVVASGRLRLDPMNDSLGLAASFEATSEKIPASELVPHAGPMVFLDRLLASAPGRTVCGVRIEALSLFRSAGGALPGWAGLEPMAQCIAAHGGLEARRHGETPRVGFLLGCRRLEIRTDWLEPRGQYAVSATQVWGREKGLVSFDCELFEREAGRRVIAGRINAYLPGDLNDVLEGQLGE
jgi:predicted hotdog family 3-hydroxylacyl-ACP dehydratase